MAANAGTAMRIGVSLSSSHPENGPKRMIERAQVAYAAGLASLTIGDHHNMAVPYAQNTPMLGRLLAEWPDRPAGCLFLMPLWHPLLMAEQIGTLAAIHRSRFIVQVGIGWGSDQFAAFGVSERTRGRFTDEAIPIIRQLLAGEGVDSEYFDMTGGRVGLVPPGPVEWWIGGGAEASLRRAADLGDVWYAGPGLDADAARPVLERYRELGGARATIRRDALVLSDGDLARALAHELCDHGYRGLTYEQLLVGTVADVEEQLAPFAEAGFEEVIVRCMSVPQELALETLSLIATANPTT